MIFKNGIVVLALLCCFSSFAIIRKKLDKVNEYLELAEDVKLSQGRRIQFNKLAFQILINDGNSIENRNQLLKVASTFKKLNCWIELKDVSEKLLKKSIEANVASDIGKSYKYLGYYFTYISKNDSALYYFLKAKKIFIKVNDKMNMSSCLSDIGLIYYFNCDYVESQSIYIQALKFARYSNRKDEDECIALMNLGIIQTALGEYEKANEYADKAQKIARDNLKNKDSYLETCLNDIGYNYYKLGSYKLAISYHLKALEKLGTPEVYPELYAVILDNLANAKYAQSKLNGVLSLYVKAAKIRDQYNVDQGKNFNNLYLAKYFHDLNNREKAYYYAYRALHFSEKFKASKDILECLKQLINIDSSNVLSHTHRYIALSDSLQLAERKNRNKFARIAFETDEITIEKDKAVKHKWIVLSIAGAILLVISLLFIIKMQRARQKRLLLIQAQQKADASIYQLINDQQLRVDEGRQAEKKRIAQELHDGIMNRLASTRLNLFMLKKKQDEETINKCLGFINNIQDIEKEIRQVAHDLNEEIFSENIGFAMLLENLFEEYRNTTSARLFTEIDAEFNWEMTESVLRMNIYRILQEALQNSYKYANARNIFVTMTREDSFARVIIHDDGTGFNTKKVKKGIGLESIAKRAESLNGTFKIISGKQEGTILNLLLPLSKSRTKNFAG